MTILNTTYWSSPLARPCQPITLGESSLFCCSLDGLPLTNVPKMKNKKYRHLMVTPAFIKARERKERNDVTYGRVLPAIEWATMATGSNGNLNESKSALSPRPIKAFSAPAPRSERLDSVKDRRDGDTALNTGNHFISWKIPERILSTGNIGDRGQAPKEPNGCMPNEVARASHFQKAPQTSTMKRREAASPREEKEQNEHDFAREWLRRYDKEDRRIAEELLRSPPANIISQNAFQQATAFTKHRPATDGSLRSLCPQQSGVSRMSSRTNILHRTSSVAWRRDSSWLKPTNVSYQSWHGLPAYPLKADVVNLTSMYMRPHKKQGSCYIIHPEWSSGA